MTTIDHAGSLAARRPETLSDEHVAGRALQVARRTALGVLGDAEAAADIAQDVAITAVRRAGALRDPAALDAWLHRIAVRAALTLRYVHDLPDTAIAGALRCRPGTVRSLLSRGREAVRSAIDEDRSPHANR